ncbi:DoxX family protein [Agromyces sp. LHK192]|uniref:DoxX family protein n=1 Tax=Agromyces sp. LHK192 TaxID=2498704 RepID=UPI001F0BC648|nr:DoxX family protein [Agromyces sp. LHK192]
MTDHRPPAPGLPAGTGTTGDASTAPRRNPWVQTFVSPVPIAFVAGTAITALTGAALAAVGIPALAGWQAAVTGGLVALFLMGAIGRLVPGVRAGLVAMVPPALPRPDLIVAATGVLEAAGALGLLFPPTHRLAAWCLAALLVAVFPANVREARRGGSPLVPRTVEQVGFVAACLAVALG